MEEKFFGKVKRIIEDREMISEGDRLVVGVSGGADSVCLFHVLLKLSAEIPFDMHVVHVHHSIRGAEADRDAAFVKELCAKYGIPFTLARYDVPRYAAVHGLSVEEAGRLLRREAFEKKADEIDGSAIVLAHHMNDVAETVLFNVARGSGIAGLASLRYARGSYIRPLLGVTREEITDWLGEKGISYCVDSTNEDSTYSRNLIRVNVLPLLTEHVNRQSVRHIFEISEEAAQIENWLTECAEKCLDKFSKSESDAVILRKEMFESEREPVSNRAVKMAIGMLSGSLKDIERKHIRAVTELRNKKNGKRLDLPYGLYAESVYDEIHIRKKKWNRKGDSAGMSVRLLPAESKSILNFENIRILMFLEKTDGAGCQNGKTENIYTKKFDYDKIIGTLVIRHRMAGDYMVIYPDGRRKSLSDLFTDRKIPREERDRIPLLACGSEILWAIGLRGGESCRIDSGTEKILTVTVSFITEGSYDRQN